MHFFAVGGVLVVGADVVGEIFQKTIDIFGRNFVQMFCREVLCFQAAKGAVFFIEITEEDPQIIGVCQTGFGRCGLSDAAEKGLGERGQLPLDLS